MRSWKRQYASISCCRHALICQINWSVSSIHLTCIHLSAHPSIHPCIQIIIEQLKPLNPSRQPVMTDATQRSLKLCPMLFTTYSPPESLGSVYSPPQNNSKERREKTSLSKVLQPSSFTMPFAGTWVTIGGNSAEIVPLMKTNWRNQGSFLLPSQEANPNNMKLPKPRFSFAQMGF